MLNFLRKRFLEMWPTIRVVATFMGLIFAFFMATDYAPIANRMNLAWGMARLAAWVAGGFLQLLSGPMHFPLLVDGTRMSSGDFIVEVSEACSGAVPTAIYFAAVCAYPASWRARFIGMGLGFVVIHSFNIVRVISLFLIGLFANQYFHDTHVYVAQSIVVAIAIATWLFWAGRFANAPGH